MKIIRVLLILICQSVFGQLDSSNFVVKLNPGQLNNSNSVKDTVIIVDINAPRKPYKVDITNTVKETALKDTTYEVVLDPTYYGTEAELSQGLSEGLLEKYFVYENDERVHERIKKVISDESFLEKYWVYIVLAGLLIFAVWYKKTQIDKDDNEEENIE